MYMNVIKLYTLWINKNTEMKLKSEIMCFYRYC